MPVEILKINKAGGGNAPGPFQRIPENEAGMANWLKSTPAASKEPAQKESTMRMRMLRTVHAGVDGGLRVQLFEAGKVYDIEPVLVESFLKYGHAEEDKGIVAAPEFKVAPAHEAPEPPVTKPHKRRGR
jgi:hypothetical protein